jgi:hypothetical protein
MKKLSILLLFLGLATFVQAQKEKRLSGYFSAGANIMAYDRFIEFTHAGAGAGLQLHYTINPKLKAQFDATVSLFSINKILFLFENGQTAGPKQFVFTTFAGLVYSPVKRTEAGISAGPSFVEDDVYAGIKPCIGYYFGKKERVKALASLTHIFEKNSISKKNTGFVSFGIAVKLF